MMVRPDSISHAKDIAWLGSETLPRLDGVGDGIVYLPELVFARTGCCQHLIGILTLAVMAADPGPHFKPPGFWRGASGARPDLYVATRERRTWLFNRIKTECGYLFDHQLSSMSWDDSDDITITSEGDASGQGWDEARDWCGAVLMELWPDLIALARDSEMMSA